MRFPGLILKATGYMILWLLYRTCNTCRCTDCYYTDHYTYIYIPWWLCNHRNLIIAKWSHWAKMASFREAFLGKRFVCCALTIVYSIYNTVGRSIASIYDLGGIFTSGRIYRLWTSLPYYIYITYIYITYININTIILIACICGDVPGTITGQMACCKDAPVCRQRASSQD